MEKSISFTNIKYYNISNIHQWIWTFKKYNNIKGFIFRFFGIYINIRENNSFDKLMNLWKNRKFINNI